MASPEPPQERLSFRSEFHVVRERNAYGKLSNYSDTLSSPRSPSPSHPYALSRALTPAAGQRVLKRAALYARSPQKNKNGKTRSRVRSTSSTRQPPPQL